MQNIMNLTIGQLITGIIHHAVWLLVILSGFLNFEAIVRQVAVNRGYKNVVSLCDRIAGIIVFIMDVAESVAKKNVASDKAAGQVMLDFILLIICCIFIIGCVSAGFQGTGVDVHDPTHGIEAQANSINAEVSVNVSH